MKGSYQSHLGWIVYEMKDDKLVSMYFADEEEGQSYNNDPFINQQLDMYFKHELTKFNIPVKLLKGTDFQRAVWNALLEIPYGTTRSYKDVAETIGNPKAVRAVGQACKRNPIGIVVPCHRVIGSDGSMTGYSGKAFVSLKKQLIDWESAYDENE